MRVDASELLHRVRQSLTPDGRDVRAVVAAVSGGLDSMVLLALLASVCAADRLPLVVCHVDHGLRGAESRRDAAFVAEQARCYGLALELRQVAPADASENAARQARYQALCDVADAWAGDGVCLVVTAHQRDDQVETILAAIVRGTGVHGLTGMPERRPLGRHELVRPLLGATRAQLAQIARGWAIAYVEDSSNRDPRYTRNRVRHELLPLLRARFNPAIDDALLRLCGTARVESQWAEASAQAAYRALFVADAHGVSCDRAAFVAQHEAQMRRVAALALEHVSREASGARSQRRIAAVCRIAGAGHGAADVGGGVRVWATRGQLRIALVSAAPEADVAPSVPVALGSVLRTALGTITVRAGSLEECGTDRSRAAFALHALPMLRLRTWRRGERVRPLGMSGSRLVSDILAEAGVPRDWRALYPVLAQDGEAVWIPGLCRSRVSLVESQGGACALFIYNREQGNVHASRP